ncbi:MAG: adenylate cyclase, partial [Mycobacterium sp.]|nr:adenylate cyclase [Mycobacterium sp.]
MDHIWQWAWDRYGPRYSWAMCAIIALPSALIYLLPVVLVVALERSSHYVEAVALTIVTLPAAMCVAVLPGLGPARLVEQWAAGGEIDPSTALAAAYTWVRGAL